MNCPDFNALFKYDPETGTLTWKIDKVPVKEDDVAGSVNGRGYRYVKIRPHSYRVCRIVWYLMTGEWPVGVIDHINGNKSDDRWVNLRECSQRQNMWNQKIHSHNTSGVPGVSFHKRNNSWRAYIISDGKQIHLGYFLEFEQAIKARKKAENQRWGNFRRVGDIVSSVQKCTAVLRDGVESSEST